MTGYDVIGDVHGHADKLEGLLRSLGYRHTAGAWRHPSRQAVFIGDLIDRGPQQLETVDLVRAMVDSGSAQMVLGNHEFNAVAYWTSDPDQPGEHRRRHTDKNRSQHQTFLDAVGDDPILHRRLTDWFMTIPLWLDLGGLRIVHACWDPRSMVVIAELLASSESPANSLTEELVISSSRPDHRAYAAVETLLKGPEIPLGAGRAYLDKDGHVREQARFRWWSPDATTLRAGAEIPGGATGIDGQPFIALPEDPITVDTPAPYTDVPVIFGHYWRTGTPDVLNPKAVCVDYSVANGGPLVAYRWSDETDLHSDNFATFPDHPRGSRSTV